MHPLLRRLRRVRPQQRLAETTFRRRLRLQRRRQLRALLGAQPSAHVRQIPSGRDASPHCQQRRRANCAHSPTQSRVQREAAGLPARRDWGAPQPPQGRQRMQQMRRCATGVLRRASTHPHPPPLAPAPPSSSHALARARSRTSAACASEPRPAAMLSKSTPIRRRARRLNSARASSRVGNDS